MASTSTWRRRARPGQKRHFAARWRINPRLSLAHKFYANLEADIGQAQRGLVRLLGEANRHGNDPELFAGLVHACRYCGLYDQSIAAHTEARRLDPNVPTSLDQTLLMTGDIDRLLTIETRRAVCRRRRRHPGDRIGPRGPSRRGEAQAPRHAPDAAYSALRSWIEYLFAWLDRRIEDMVGRSASRAGLKIQDDPEAMFQEGWLFCDLGEHERGLALLQRAITKGYFVSPTLARAPQFDALSGRRAFIALIV